MPRYCSAVGADEFVDGDGAANQDEDREDFSDLTREWRLDQPNHLRPEKRGQCGFDAKSHNTETKHRDEESKRIELQRAGGQQERRERKWWRDHVQRGVLF